MKTRKKRRLERAIVKCYAVESDVEDGSLLDAAKLG